MHDDLVAADRPERLPSASTVSREVAVVGVVLEQVGQRLGVGDVVDGNDLDLALVVLAQGLEHLPADATESVDTYLNRHSDPPELYESDCEIPLGHADR